MRNYLFYVIEGFDPEIVKQDLEKKGLQDAYLIEEEDGVLLGGRSLEKLTHRNTLLIDDNAKVDWNSQWEDFAQNFADGKAHIDIGNKTLKLLPGAGFGDLSHPTTKLMLKMMELRTEGKIIFDIGSGSGILTLGAILLGARFAYGIEIDPKALKHAKKNAKLNGLEKPTKFLKNLPKNIPLNSLFCMNMILSEQRAFNPARCPPGTWIVSGVLCKQKKEYLKTASKWGWTLLEEYQQDGWLGLIFESK